MTYEPTRADLLDMSLHSFREHASELVSKWDQLTLEQRKEFREIAMSILTSQNREAA